MKLKTATFNGKKYRVCLELDCDAICETPKKKNPNLKSEYRYVRNRKDTLLVIFRKFVYIIVLLTFVLKDS